MAALPQLAGLYKKYADQDFHIIGLESQGSDEATVKRMATGGGVTFQVTRGGHIQGANVKGIPHGYLFGADGQMIADDPHGKALEDAVKKALQDATALLAGPGPYKKLAAQAAQVRAGQGLGQVLKTLRAKKDSKDAEEAREAALMLDALGAFAKGRLDRALALKDSDPASAVERLDKVALQFAGDEVGDQAKKESEALKRDPKARKEIEAAAVWKQVQAMVDRLKPVGGETNPKSDAFRRANQALLQQIMMGCQMLTRNYPGTAAATKAEQLVNEYK